MRKLLFLLSIFAIVLSCSSDETSTPVTPPPAPIVKYTITLSAGEGGTVSTTGGEYEAGQTVTVTATPQGEYLFKDWSDGNTNATRTITVSSNSTLTANFEKKKYPLTVNIEGEGEVLEEIVNSGRTTDYDSGTTVKLTAIPAEDGWSVFKKWSGSVNSTETSIEINISEPTTINAVFEESNFIVTKNRTRIEVEGVVLEDIRATFYDVSGSFYYTHNGNEYFFNSGNRWISGELWNTSLDPQSLPKIPHLILKKFDNKWLLDQVHRVSATRLVRNPVKYGNQLIIADAGEIGNNADLWLGDAWIGELVPDNIEWRKINPDGEKTFWHGVTAGDINGDGLTDIGGVPAPDYRLYVQNQDGTFSNQRNIWSYSDSNDSPFTIAFIDVDGDGRDEIITADYGEQNQNQLNNVQTYKYNDKNERFERIFVSNEPEAFYSLSECPRGLGGTSIKASDFNNDGNIDISVAREDSCGSAFEVWLGDGNGEFKPHWSNFFRGTDLQNWREFKLMDVNNDNNMDIVLRPDGYGSLFRISPVQYDPVASGGVKLNNSIWINDGQGNFSAYENKELEIKDVFVDFLEPFMKDGILHFIGTTTLPDDAHYGEDAITLSIYDIKVRIE
ncbi:VCBS repeat-containing protein [Flavobacteriaceae bacterium]|nr:VCBS repeat-containing protein [Flavobacteriaceae bacterium]